MKALLDWEALGFEITAVCHSGKSALAEIEKGQVELLLCDVKMPEMSGIDLVQQVSRKDSSIPCCTRFSTTGWRSILGRTHCRAASSTSYSHLEVLNRESELNYLRSQINPHFLYNTLETVRGMAAMEGAPMVQQCGQHDNYEKRQGKGVQGHLHNSPLRESYHQSDLKRR